MAGGNKGLLGKSISKELEEKLTNRETSVSAKGEKGYISIAKEHGEEASQQVISPIICEGDVIGAVVLLDNDDKGKMGDVEKKLVLSAAAFLGRQMEQ